MNHHRKSVRLKLLLFDMAGCLKMLLVLEYQSINFKILILLFPYM